jgi:predicted DNA-binding transcriptional regulator AlpA
MYEKPNPAELLKEWMKEYETKIRELQSVSAYLGARVDRLERSSSLPAPSPAPGSQPAAPFLTVEEVAKLLSSTPHAIRAKLRRREFPTGILVRIGRRGIRFDREKLLTWIRSKEIKNPMDGILDR